MPNHTNSSTVRVTSPARTGRQRTIPAIRRAGMLVVLAAGLWGCIGVSPQAELDAAESLISLNDALLSLREDQAYLQEQLDELRRTVAAQDSLIRRVADFTGAPIPR